MPHPPLLVPELVGGAVAETAQLRAACEAAAGQLVAAGARRWVAVAADVSGPRRVPPPVTGTFAGYGVDVPVALRSGVGLDTAGAARLPLPMLVAGWLRERVGAAEVVGELLHPSTTGAECAAQGRALWDAGGRVLADSEQAHLVGEPVGLLVLGDGASMHAAPGAGRVDERAGPFDAAVRDALASADTGALRGLDERLATELGVTGRPGWQVLAGAAERAGRSGTSWRAELLYSAAPYGVAYHVAVWRPCCERCCER